MLLFSLDAAGRFCARGGGFTIRLTARFIGCPELLFLLADNVAPALHPVSRLLARLASLLSHPLTSLLSLGNQHLARFFSGARSVQYAHYGSDPETRQKPHKAVAITIRHDFLLTLAYWMVAPGLYETQFTVIVKMISRTCSRIPRSKALGRVVDRTDRHRGTDV